MGMCMNKKTTSIVILDDGINEKLYNTGDLEHNLEVTSDLQICERVGYDPFLPSHGTTCAAIIKKYVPEAALSSIKILSDESRKGMKEQLICALKWCADNAIRLVNLSLGTIDYRDFNEIKEAVNYAGEKGVVIVAACNNRNIFTCPASLENVIGVRCDLQDKLKEREYTYGFSPDGIEITSSGSHKLVKFSDEVKITTPSNSFAAPVITSIVYELQKNNPDISLYDIRELLKERAGAENAGQNIQSLDYHPSKVYNYLNKRMDIPVIVLYNYYGKNNDIDKNLNRKFRLEGYNAIIAFTEKNETDHCSGHVFIGDLYINGFDSVGEGIFKVSTIFDPDIICVSVDMSYGNAEHGLKDIELNIDPDIEIFVYHNLTLKITSSYETRTMSLPGNNQIDTLYSYIMSLFEKEEEKK